MRNSTSLLHIWIGYAALALHSLAWAHPLQRDVNVTLTSNASTLAILPNGNLVVLDPNFSSASAARIGVVHLFRPDGTLISSLTGATAGDGIGSGVSWYCPTAILSSKPLLALPGVRQCLVRCGYVDRRKARPIRCRQRHQLAGWRLGSYLGHGGGDLVGSEVFPLVGGDYVVSGNGVTIAPGLAGTLTRGNGRTGTTGQVTSANSLVGGHTGDLLGATVTSLPDGAVVVASSSWWGNRGAVTHLRSGASFSGVVSEVNSLVGTRLGDSVGSAVTVLANGNYVICSPTWSASDTLLKVGAATWVDKNAPRTGALAAADSLTGAQAGDQVCDGGVVALNGNSNYVVSSSRFKSGAVMVGAATWGDGASGRKGVVSATNSLLGTGGSTTAPMPIKVTPLRGNGNYVVALAGSTRASGVIGDSMGAAPVVWADGRFGITGIVPAAASSYVSNSGTFFDTQVVPLSNGNYVVGRPQWDNARGAVHWGEGIGGAAVGLLTEATALTGSSAGDSVGVGAIVALTNGNYVVISPEWRGQQGL
jgi:hypothetical protein